MASGFPADRSAALNLVPVDRVVGGVLAALTSAEAVGTRIHRPDSFQVFRMVCRHNRYVLRLGSLKDPDEIARRERLWERAIDDIEFHTGRSAAALPHAQFLRLMQQRLDLDRFEPRASA